MQTEEEASVLHQSLVQIKAGVTGLHSLTLWAGLSSSGIQAMGSMIIHICLINHSITLGLFVNETWRTSLIQHVLHNLLNCVSAMTFTLTASRTVASG